jgi:hypothetical protein
MEQISSFLVQTYKANIPKGFRAAKHWKNPPSSPESPLLPLGVNYEEKEKVRM